MNTRLQITLALLLAGACPSLSLAQDTPPKIAVLAGVNEYKHGDLNRPKALQYAENDVSAMAETLRAAGYTVHLLQGKEGTKENILATLAKARKQTADKGVFLIGLAGHGMQPEKSEDAYFCPYDTDQKVGTKKGEDPWDYRGMLPLSDVLDFMKASSAGSRILLMDACRNDPTAGRGRGVGTNLKISDIPNTAVLLSCSQGQRSFEDKAWGGGHGVFFHHVLTGLKGEPSVLKGGKINIDLLWSYLEEEVPKQVTQVGKDPFTGSSPTQEPFRLLNGKVDLLIASGNKPMPKNVLGDPKPGEERDFEIYKGVKMRFCWVPSGKATLGSPADEKERSDDEKERPFETKGFWLGKYEVTQGEYEGVTGDTPSKFKGTKLPVEQVSWEDCQKFIEKCGVKGMKLKLPHEDEWEYACRCGKGNKQAFYVGDELTVKQANFRYEKEQTIEVGSYEKAAGHPWGLCDMSGNVLEWCENLYSTGGSGRVSRGGGWQDLARFCRSACRCSYDPTYYRSFSLGFRLALVP